MAVVRQKRAHPAYSQPHAHRDPHLRRLQRAGLAHRPGRAQPHQDAAVEVLNQAFFAQGNVATAGGCLASPYLAAWVIARLQSVDAAREALHYVEQALTSAPIFRAQPQVHQPILKVLISDLEMKPPR